ncbi:porin PorA family protein [Nocardioides panaciterrulae]|uniref:DUF3068 domain-containing protein n=1 Tax=Nocardioides panaciterrulae TaxID=661492 RepID=A0A7Y9E5C4_9ACTN|nr:hypothetical protein [Nocardioides panaciterrulae]
MKRRWLGAVLVALGAFLIVAAVVAQTWAPDNVKRTPIDVNSTTHLGGSADKLNPKTGKLESYPIYVLDINQNDSNRSDGSVAVFVRTTCVVIDNGQKQVCPSDKDPNLIDVTIDTFATDRHTAMSINDPQYLPKNFVPHTGLVNKFPFDAQKQTYPYWDNVLQAPVDAVYQRTAEVKGLQTYVYRAVTKNAKVDVIAGTPDSKPVKGTYDDVRDVYVDPHTGSIVDQAESQQRYLTDGTKILDLKAEFTSAEQQAKVDEARSKWSQITMVLDTVPLVGYAVGIPVLLIGLALLFLRRRGDQPAAPEPERTETPVGV